MPKLTERWEKRAAALLVGRKVKAVSYLEPKELLNLEWDRASLAIQFDNGLVVFASQDDQDDEGNGPGALFTTDKNLPTIPVI